MDRGIGFGRTGHLIPSGLPPGPPFALNSADNGDSVDPVSRRIVLGNNVGLTTAKLLSTREIPFNGFQILLTDTAGATGSVLTLAENGIVLARNFPGLNGFTVSINDGNADIILTGDIGGGSTPPSFGFIDGNPAESLYLTNLGGEFAVQDNVPTGNRFLSLDFINGIYQLGDIDALGNGNRINIDDSIGQLVYGTVAGSSLLLDNQVGLYEIGDISAILNNSYLFIDDTNKLLSYQSAGTQYMSINAVAHIYAFGDDNLVNEIIIQGGGAQVIAAKLTGKNYLLLDAGANNYNIGDISVNVNGTFLEIDDTAQSFNFNNSTAGVALINPQGGIFRIATPATNDLLQILDATGANGIQISSAGIIGELSGAPITIAGQGIQTADPGSGVGTWLLGTRVAAVSVFDPTGYVETKINGAIVKLATVA